MTVTLPAQKIDFQPLSPRDKALYERYLSDGSTRGCEYSFANLYLWGRQTYAVLHDHILLFSQFDRRSVYPYPIGKGDKKAALDAIMADARARGIPCRITGLGAEEKATLEALYPGKFRFHCDEGTFDYVYAIDDLAELKGKKYHGKRNHIHRFRDAFPHYRTAPLSEENLPAVKEMVAEWYRAKSEESPNSDYHMERTALEKALAEHEALGMEGLVLLDGETVLAVTLGSRLSDDTLDVQFEKARAGAEGAYTAVNYEFARYIRDKYPAIRFLDREEDMGLEGLRRAKQSYHPHHMIEKCWAYLLEDGYEG